MRILIVEDNGESRAVLREMLESMGNEVDESTNSADALGMIAEDPEISLVLLDLGLPPQPHGFSEGFDFLRQVREVNSLLKVIVVSGHDLHTTAKELVEFSAFDYLQKPFGREVLANAIYRGSVSLLGEHELRSDAKVPMFLIADASQQSGVKLFRESAMAQLLRAVLNSTRHNVSAAARQLNMSREHLYYYLKKHGIQRPAD